MSRLRGDRTVSVPYLGGAGTGRYSERSEDRIPLARKALTPVAPVVAAGAPSPRSNPVSYNIVPARILVNRT